MSENPSNPQNPQSKKFHKKKFIIILIILILFVFISTFSKNSVSKISNTNNSLANLSTNENSVSVLSSIKSNIEYINTKREEEKFFYNEMILYSVGEKPDFNEIKEFCITKKQTFKDGAFHILVFFDKKENAKFPNNPVTANFGMDMEILKNIKATYTFNLKNGFSELQISEENALIDQSSIIKI